MNMNAKILLLDDEPLVQMILRARLEQAGALVVEARCCSEALALARKTVFDAGVFDHRLPDGSGMDVVRTLHGEGVSFPVVMLSGDSNDLSAVADQYPNICSVQVKPPNPKHVVEALAEAMGCTVKREAIRVGRYAFWKAEAGEAPPPECIQDEWLAIDLKGLDAGKLHPAVFAALGRARSGTAVIGGDDSIRYQLEANLVEIDYVGNVDELAALSRRPSSPLERNAVLSAIFSE